MLGPVAGGALGENSLSAPVFVAAAAQIARQSQEIGDLKNTQLIAGSVVMAPGFLEAAGDAYRGIGEFSQSARFLREARRTQGH